EQFQQLRASRREKSGQHSRQGKPGRPPNGLLATIAACGECGGRMDSVPSRYVRKDGSRARTYTCRTHRERPQDCAAKPFDAGVIDAAVIANLNSFLGDVNGWRDRLISTQEAERDRLERQAQTARDDAAKAARRIAALQTKAES